MKKMASAFLLLTVFTTFNGNAQLRTAIAGGVQMSSVPGGSSNQWDSLDHKYSSRSGFNFGILAEAPFFNSNHVYFRTGMMYSNKGRKFSSQFDTTSGIRTVEGYQFTNYIEIPLNVAYKADLGRKTRFVLGGGPYVSFLFSGKEATQTTLSNGLVTPVENTSLKVPRAQGNYKNVDFGLNAFAGIEAGKVFLRASFSRGLGQFYQTYNHTGTFKHQVIGATAGIFLNRENRKDPKHRDRDNDGVPDVEDACPREKGSALSKGCPDKDGDGIPDKDDSCPNLAGTAKRSGCPPPDTDKDGVNDDEDKCIDEKGTKENHGCPENEVSLQGTFESYAKRIQFRYKSAELTESSKEVLDNVIRILKRNPGLNVLIEGYTSKDGRNHQKISQERAESVRAYLELNGIKAKRLKAIGFGATNPLNEERTEAERALNRRVELKITK